jgi:hypothetical protein
MPLPAAVAFWMGPAAVAAAKAMCYEYLPAVSSATLGYLLTRLAWRRCVPEWIRNDISFQGTITGSSFSSPKRSTRGRSGSAEEKKNDDRNADNNELERISSVIEKIQALMASAQENINDRHRQRSSSSTRTCTNSGGSAGAGAGAVVPHIYASILAYIQLSAQLTRISLECQQQQQQHGQHQGQETTRRQHHHSLLLYQSAGPSIFTEQQHQQHQQQPQQNDKGATSSDGSNLSEISMLQTAMECGRSRTFIKPIESQ